MKSGLLVGAGVALALFVQSGVGQAAASTPAGKNLPRWRDHTGMVFVRGGEFVRGDKLQVRVSSFYMDQHEVTNEQYCQFLNDGKGQGPQHWNDKQEIDNQGGKFLPKAGKERWPVAFVSWHDATAYAAWAGKRLPTESEWEWAAAGREGRKFPWGQEPLTPQRANFGLNVGHPQPVGSYPEGKNPLGLFDLVGNVAEWCLPDLPEGEAVKTNAKGKLLRAWRGGCWVMGPEHQSATARSPYAAEARVPCIGFRCVRPARRVLLLLGENFEEVEFGAYTGVASWAAHTTREGNYVFPQNANAAARPVPVIEVVVGGFTAEVRGMGGMIVRPHVMLKNLKPEEIERFDAVAIPACVGGGRGQHTWQGRGDLESPLALNIVRRVHANGGFISTMCAGSTTLHEAKLPLPKRVPGEAVAYDKVTRTATSAGPGVAVEAACLLVQVLISPEEYRSFRLYNPWLFGGKDQFPPRADILK